MIARKADSHAGGILAFTVGTDLKQFPSFLDYPILADEIMIANFVKSSFLMPSVDYRDIVILWPIAGTAVKDYAFDDGYLTIKNGH